MKGTIYSAVYLLAIVVANLLAYAAGPENAWWAMPAIAFTLIGLDLSLRDQLHEVWRGNGLVVKMGVLIGAGALLSSLINPSSGQLALASTVAFAVGATADALVWHLTSEWSYLKKANASNVAGAMADSLLFPVLAFGVWLPVAILGQFVAKAFGGALWALLIKRWRSVATAVFVVGLTASPVIGQVISAHYDVARQTPITALNYGESVGERLHVNGFVEVWWNPQEAYPSRRPVVFSKHWIAYQVAGPLSLSAEVEVSRNMAGAYARWPARIPFKAEQWYVQPKVGVSFDLGKALGR